MDWLNYHHLLYFWTTAREGGVGKAAARLNLSHATVSSQIKRLEAALGDRLFRRVGRRMELTELGRTVYGYADEIFSLGRELLDVVHAGSPKRAPRLLVGVADVVPKLIVRRLLEPARHLPEPVRIVCHEDKPERLLAELALHRLDLVLSDMPVGVGASVRAYSHALGECGTSLFATRRLAARHRRGFPRSLSEAPFLLPTENTELRRALDAWFEAKGVRPAVVGEFEDSALLSVFGQDGMGIFPAPSAIESAVLKQYGVALVGRLPEVRERFYAITVARRLEHPAVVAISRAARRELFA